MFFLQTLRPLTTLSLLVVLASSTVADGVQAQSKTRFSRWAYQDVGSLFGGANKNTLYYTIGGLAGLGAMLALDRTVNHEVQEGYKGVWVDYTNATNKLGDPLIILPTTGIFVTSLFTRNTRFQDAAFTSLQSLFYTGGIVYLIKNIVGRYRPEENEGPFQFAPFSKHSSFPSGHTAAAFAILTSWARYYPSAITWGLVVAGAGGTALARIAKDKHWGSDVLGGGVVGFLIATSLSKKHQRVASSATIQNNISFVPIVGPGSFQMTMRF